MEWHKIRKHDSHIPNQRYIHVNIHALGVFEIFIGLGKPLVSPIKYAVKIIFYVAANCVGLVKLN